MGSVEVVEERVCELDNESVASTQPGPQRDTWVGGSLGDLWATG